jgi:AraC-like DNA-binding protein
MNVLRPVTIRDLSEHGIHCVDDPALTVRWREAGDVTVVSLSAPAAMDVELAAGLARPRRVAIAFLTSNDLVTTISGQYLAGAEDQSALMVAADNSMRVRFHGRWRLTLALVPLEPLASGFLSALRAPVRLERRPLDGAMQRYIEVLLDGESDPSETELHAVGQLVIEMSAAVLLDRGAGIEGPMCGNATYQRAIAIIKQQCADPTLSPAKVARSVHCSLRLLQARFAEQRNSIAGEIRRQRVRRAHAMLTDARCGGLSVEEISYRAGFRAPVSMRRAFDREYGTTPRTLRCSPASDRRTSLARPARPS